MASSVADAKDSRTILNAPPALDGYMAYLQGDAPRGRSTCDEIRDEYAATMRNRLESQSPMVRILVFEKPEPGVIGRAPGIVFMDMGATLTEAELEADARQIGQHIEEGSRQPGHIPDISLVFGAKVRLFEAYQIVLGGNVVEFDLSDAPKCRD